LKMKVKKKRKVTEGPQKKMRIGGTFSQYNRNREWGPTRGASVFVQKKGRKRGS